MNLHQIKENDSCSRQKSTALQIIFHECKLQFKMETTAISLINTKILYYNTDDLLVMT